MKAFFGVLVSLFSIYLAIHAIVWVILLVWGFGPAATLLFFFFIPVFIVNAFDLCAAAAGDNRRRSDWKRRRQWRGY